MNEEEIAMQITLKAIETGAIVTPINPQKDDVGHKSSYNTKLICDFYKKILGTIQMIEEDDLPTE